MILNFNYNKWAFCDVRGPEWGANIPLLFGMK